ncbi:uncharacterized protein LOC110056449 [Orbicella faveolata]|uniref:uncharacterized protein LOC110056449 n=1 Tax=Orbicella faveolata TaxID=48498 RepID=UPI0009E638D1|nr:uncharacterized protein LOC110056449 [Orbicella faveolata]
MRIPPKKLGFRTASMAAAVGVILFTYICLVFLVTHRICMMQCNPMSRPGVYQGDMGDVRFSGSHVQNDGSHQNRRDQPNIRHIRFEPSYLDFYEQSVGMPSIRTVSVINPHTEQNLQLQSISGSTAHFHASFFQSKVVHPLGNTTFDIVFLARLVGNVENTLFIHTSKGVYPYQVFGVGLPNPYRLRPFLGARVPLNFSFSTIINMHNPYDSPLQVSSLTGLTAQECLHIIVVQLITNYLFQSKQQCAAITIITTASVYHINLEKSISISVFSSLSCVSSVLLDYCRNMGWMCFIVSM